MSVSTLNREHDKHNATEVTLRKIQIEDINSWLQLGWQDYKKSPIASLTYGLLFTTVCLAIAATTFNYPGFFVALFTGLLLIGPALALGTYTAARQHQSGQQASITQGVALIRSRATNLSLFAVLLVLIMVAWVRFTSLLFAVQFQITQPSLAAYTEALFTSSDGLMILGLFYGAGFILASTVFVTSAISIPMILDRDTDPFTAVQTSFSAVMENKGVMATWAITITSLTVLGMLSGFIAMIVLFPLLGYATWHSYQALVK